MSRGRFVSWSIVVASLLLVEGWPAAQRARDQHWVATWGTAQLAYRAPAAARAAGAATAPPAAPATSAPPSSSPPTPSGPQRRFPVPPPLAGLSNQTIRMIVRSSIGGDTVRVRLSHAFGASAVVLGSAHIAVRRADSSIVAGTDHTVTFGGQPTTTLFGGSTVVSDPVTLSLKPLTDLAISLYFPNDTGPPTGHTFGLRPTYVTGSGDFTGAETLADVKETLQSYYWLTGVDVLAPASAAAVVTFGDSITDGDQSTPDRIAMWPAGLAERLLRSRPPLVMGVVNAGISGNRVLGDNNSGLARFARDALAVPGVKWITLLEGINDITGATRPGAPASTFDATNLIQAYGEMIALAHQHGVQVFGCTLTPYGGSNVFSDRGERIRQDVNAWIRARGHFDAVIDFDAAVRAAAAPDRFRAEADSPDLLHPGDAGYRLMAEAIDLRLFSRR